MMYQGNDEMPRIGIAITCTLRVFLFAAFVSGDEARMRQTAVAVPLDLLKSEQQRLTRDRQRQSRLAEVAGDFKKAETNLKLAVTRAGDQDGLPRGSRLAQAPFQARLLQAAAHRR
jgi:hypothetical protein